MKSLFLIILISTTTLSACKVSQKAPSITGTYELVSKTLKEGDDVYGYAGNIQVKELPNNNVVLSFFITKGAPSYNSGSFVDTLNYSNNLAVCKLQEDSIRCEIAFLFNGKGINVKQESTDLYYGCGFGNGVVAHGFFKKVSSKEPIIQDLAWLLEN